MGEGKGVLIEGLDVLDVLRFVSQKNRKFIAIALKELEEIMGESKSEKYKLIRKLFLDTMNNYTRSFLRIVFGDIEGLVEHVEQSYNESKKS